MNSLCENIFLTGTHGTSMSRATEILKQKKFMPSKEGQAGAGVYFWEVADSLDFSMRLAENWWRNASQRLDSYKGDADTRLAIIKAKISPLKNEFYDATQHKFISLCCQLADQQKIEQRKDLLQLRLTVLSEIEKESDHTYSVIKIEVDVPGKAKGEKITPSCSVFKKQATCFVVKKKAEEVITDIQLI